MEPEMDKETAIVILTAIYDEINLVQRHGYVFGSPLHAVPGFTMYLERAMTELSSAKAAIEESTS